MGTKPLSVVLDFTVGPVLETMQEVLHNLLQHFAAPELRVPKQSGFRRQKSFRL